MLQLVLSLLAVLSVAIKPRRDLVLENVGLRHQLAVLTRSARRPRLQRWDRPVWIVLHRLWADWKEALVLVQPATVVRWHREGFRRFWCRRSQRGVSATGARPCEDGELFVQLSDPRVSKRPIFAKSQPCLRKLCKEEVAKRTLDAAAEQEAVRGTLGQGLNWQSTELAREDIPPLPDDPERTREHLHDTLLRFFRVVASHHCRAAAGA